MENIEVVETSDTEIEVKKDGKYQFNIGRDFRFSLGFMDMEEVRGSIADKTFELIHEKIIKWAKENELVEIWIFVEKGNDSLRTEKIVEKLGFSIETLPEKYGEFVDGWLEIPGSPIHHKKVGCMRIDENSEKLKEEEKIIETIEMSLEELVEEGYMIFPYGFKSVAQFELYCMGEMQIYLTFEKRNGMYYVDIDGEEGYFEKRSEIKDTLRDIVNRIQNKKRLTKLFEKEEPSLLFQKIFSKLYEEWIERFWEECRKTKTVMELEKKAFQHMKEGVQFFEKPSECTVFYFDQMWYAFLHPTDVFLKAETEEELIQKMLQEKEKIYRLMFQDKKSL